MRPLRTESSHDDPRLPLGLGPKRTAILRMALHELDADVREVPPRSNRGPRVDVYLPRWAQTNPGPPWCAWFVTWVLEQALGVVPTGQRRGGTAALMNDAMRTGLWREKREGYFPSPGDVFMMRNGDGTGHTGIVLGFKDGQIETVEGNSGDRVRFGLRRLDDPRLTGFICTVPEETFASCWWTGLGRDVSGAGTR